jgi:hypothetical protein
MLEDFVLAHRDEIINRCRLKVAQRPSPPPTPEEIDHGVPMFLDELMDELHTSWKFAPGVAKEFQQQIPEASRARSYFVTAATSAKEAREDNRVRVLGDALRASVKAARVAFGTQSNRGRSASTATRGWCWAAVCQGGGPSVNNFRPLVTVQPDQKHPSPRRDQGPRHRQGFGVIDHVQWRRCTAVKILLARRGDPTDRVNFGAQFCLQNQDIAAHRRDLGRHARIFCKTLPCMATPLPLVGRVCVPGVRALDFVGVFEFPEETHLPAVGRAIHIIHEAPPKRVPTISNSLCESSHEFGKVVKTNCAFTHPKPSRRNGPLLR